MRRIVRKDIDVIRRKLGYAPAVTLLGPRQVGKTTLAKSIAEVDEIDAIYLDLESVADREKIIGNVVPFLTFHKDKLVILDEVQTIPSLFSEIRGVIDNDRRVGRFILLGSASPILVKGVSESLAGRISFVEIPPLRLTEVMDEDIIQQDHWVRGGYPDALLAGDQDQWRDWMASYIRSYIERDLDLLFGYNFNPQITRRLWTMISHQSGSTLNSQSLARSIGVTAPVINRYIEFMEGAFLLYRLLPWFSNTKKRLVKSPKIYIRDTGILHFLQGIHDYETLFTHPIIGASWESYVVSQVHSHKSDDVDLYFYRTHSGSEIDLLITKNQKPIIAAEIKLSNTPSVARGFHTACADLYVEQKVVITPGADLYPIKNGIIVMSLRHFLTEVL